MAFRQKTPPLEDVLGCLRDAILISVAASWLIAPVR